MKNLVAELAEATCNTFVKAQNPEQGDIVEVKAMKIPDGVKLTMGICAI